MAGIGLVSHLNFGEFNSMFFNGDSIFQFKNFQFINGNSGVSGYFVLNPGYWQPQSLNLIRILTGYFFLVTCFGVQKVYLGPFVDLLDSPDCYVQVTLIGTILI